MRIIHNESESMKILLNARKFSEYIPLEAKRIYIAAGSQSTQFLTMTLRYLLYERGIPADIREGGYNSFREEIIDKNSTLYEFDPHYVIIFPYHTDECDFTCLWSNLDGRAIIQSNYVTPICNTYGRYANNFSKTLAGINSSLYASKPQNVVIADINELASQIGKRQWFDNGAYSISKLGCAMKYIPYLADYFAGIVAASVGKIRKCLVLDLDNTIWGGVVAEEGANGITLDPNNAKGEIFRSFQLFCKGLKERGVILAVASKNDEHIAKQPFTENPNMVLKLSDIAIFKANWNDKSTSLSEIAAELNIGIDSLVFFDDNPAEREVISQLLPGVLVVDVPDDPAQYILALYDCGAFDILSLSDEDVKRAESYSNDAKRRELQTNTADYAQYLQSLEMKARLIRGFSLRFSQLINKSNQFNLRTQRYTDAQIQAFARDKNYSLLSIEFEDKFDYYNIICCVILKHDGETCFIDTWVMSCRVLKRGIEHYVLNAIIEEVLKDGITTIKGEYIPTEKNTLVKSLLDDLGFSLISDNNGIKQYELNVAEAKKQKHYIGKPERR